MLYPGLSGLENLGYFSQRSAERELDDSALRSLAGPRAGLQAEAMPTSPSREYSKGMRQKVGVAIALAKNATALLLDEPTSGLDPKASNEFSAAARGAQRCRAPLF